MATEKEKQLKTRPPVVVVMGHVDHGKTTLLDYIRKTNVAGREAGGITQAIGAYEIVHADKKITFIDTPGHEAFANMRAHGAKSADIAILVVAADEGIKPQTKDALKAITSAEIPFIVAINKTDKPNADITKVKNELGQEGVFVEGYGGNISWQAVSAKTGEGVQELLDLILLAAELEQLTYDPTLPASGIVLTAHRDARKGIIVGVVVENGTLKKGMYIGTGATQGKIKMLHGADNKQVSELCPSAPALIMGFEELPEAGEAFTTSEKPMQKEVKVSASPLDAKAKTPEVPGKEGASQQIIPIVLKAHESGSLEALQDLVKRHAASFPIIVAGASVGTIHETDMKFAESMEAVILGFNVDIDRAAQNFAQSRATPVITSPIIYELEKELIVYLDKVFVKEMRALEVLGVFGKPNGKQQVVGGRIILGPVKNQEAFEIWHSKRMLGKGKMLNLQSKRQDAVEAPTGVEVGMLVESETPIKIGYTLIFGEAARGV